MSKTDLPTHARAVVIGGGVVGVSTLYHLAKMGWKDVVLIERRELTSGSTWHAAGLLPLFNMSYSVGQIHKYSVDLYGKLQAQTGQDVGLKTVSNIRLATNQNRMDEYLQYAGVARTIGVEVEFMSPDELIEMWPLARREGLIGAMRHPHDGYVQPADLTQAFAIGARANGARIFRNTCVSAIEQNAQGEWIITTDKGQITCEHVVSATGNFARQTGAMIGLDVPVIPVEHQYIVTEPHPDIQKRAQAGLPELGVLRESDGSWYLREEAGGFILGPYEKGAPACYVDGPDPKSEYELFQEDLERLMPHIESCIARVPAFAEVGIKKVYNGAIAYTPDGNPIIGPAWGKRGFWLNEGHSFGVTAAGGAGWQLAHWIVEGEPTIDMLGVGPRRFGDYATKSYLIEKNEEAYAHVFEVHYPDEERPAARPLRTTPCYERLRDKGAVFGQLAGWERANWFALEGMEAVDEWSFRRAKWFEPVGGECKNVTENVGILDMSAFAKARLQGAGAEEFLNLVLANKMPVKVGRLGLTHGLTDKGGVHSEFTVHKEGKDKYYLVSAGAWHRMDHDWMRKQMAQRVTDFPYLQCEDLTNSMGVLVIAGPKSRDLLAELAGADLANASFPWLTGQDTHIGHAPVKLLRVNFVGELGYEIHHPMEYQNYIFDLLFAHDKKNGHKFGLKPFGIRAMNSMRLEKSYRLIGTEMSIEYAAYETDLHRFVSLKKPHDFIGRAGLLAWQERGFENAFATIEVLGVDDADALGNNPLYAEGQIIGRATSGGYGFRLQKSLALGMVKPEFAHIGQKLKIDILGKLYDAVIVQESPFDSQNERLRS